MSLISGFLARKEAKKTRKAQEAANEEAETRAKEAAGLNRTKENPGADIVFGASDEDSVLLRRKSRRGTGKSSSSVFGPIGGL